MINLMKNGKKLHRFYKEHGIWYIDLPEFLEKGLGTRANLMMVGGADTYLDKISNNTSEVTVLFSDQKFEGFTDEFNKIKLGQDAEYLERVGHAKVDGGAYYTSVNNGHQIWLCPVTKYVFKKDYPDQIYLSVKSN